MIEDRIQKLKKERNQRNHIEGKFGQAKNAYGLSSIKAKRSDTSQSWIGAIFFIMNLISLEKISEAREIGVKRFNEMGGPANWAEMNSINTSRHELNLLENVVENYINIMKDRIKNELLNKTCNDTANNIINFL